MTDPALERSNARTHWLVWGTWVCLAGSLALFAYGFLHTGILDKPLWTHDGLQRLGLVTAIYWVAALCATWWFGSERMPILITAALLVVAAAAQFAAVAAVMLLFASAWSIGNLLLRRGRQFQSGLVDEVVQMAVGLAVLSWLLSLLALVPFANPATYFALQAIPLLFNGRSFIAAMRERALLRFRRPSLAEFALTVALGNLLLVLLLAALLPEVGSDALSHHLALIAYLRNFGSWHFDLERSLLALMPLAGDFVYAAPFMLAGEYAAKLANFGCFLLLLGLVYGWVRETASRSLALLATLCAAASPLALMETNSLFIENPWALFLVASLGTITRLRDRPDPANLYAAAITFGGAIATKMLALAAAPVIAIALVGVMRHEVRLRVHLAWAVALGLLVAIPPYAIALIKSGNPIFPFFNTLFKSPYFDSVSDYRMWAGVLDPLILYHATFHSDRYLESSPGALGFVPLLILPFVIYAVALAGRWRERIIVAGLVSFALILLGGSAYLRYLYPIVFMMAMAMGTTIASLKPISRRLALTANAVAVLGVLAGLPMLAASAPQAHDFRIAAAFSAEEREEFIRAWAAHRRIVERINLEPRENGNVAFFSTAYTAWLERPAVLRSSMQPHFREELGRDYSTAHVAKVLAAHDVGYVVVDPYTPPALEQAVRELGHVIMEHGAVRLYQLDVAPLLTREALVETEPKMPSQYWLTAGSPTVADNGVARVTSRDLLYHIASATAQTRYLLSVDAQCADNAGILRLQLVWYNAAKKDIGAMARDRPCSPQWREESTTIVSPPDAAYVTVYAVAATPAAVNIRHVSMRSR